MNVTVDTKSFSDFTISIWDIQGRKLKTAYTAATASAVELNFQNYRNGLYFVSLIDKDGRKYYGKIVKQ